MDPVRHNMHEAALDEDSVTDLGARVGDMQMGGDPDMLLDDYDAMDEKPEVAVIHPSDSPDETELEPLANDCMAAFPSPRAN